MTERLHLLEPVVGDEPLLISAVEHRAVLESAERVRRSGRPVAHALSAFHA